MRASKRLMLTMSTALVVCIGSSVYAHAGATAADAAMGEARRAHEAYTTAINSNNLKSLMAIVTDDVVFLSPNEPVVVGKPAVRAWGAAYLKAFHIQWDKSVSEFVVAGGVGVRALCVQEK